MKILQIIQQPQLRGAEIFASQLAEALTKKEHQVDVLFIFGSAHAMPFAVNYFFLHAQKNKRWLQFSAYKRLAQLIKNNKYDIVQANAGDTVKYAAISKALFGWKTPLVIRNASTISRYIKRWLVKLLNGWFYGQAQAVVSVSHATAKDFENLFPAWRGRVQVIPIGVVPKVLDAAKPSSPPCVLHIGGFSFEKNHAALLRIFRQVAVQVPNVKLVLVGDGPLMPSIQQLAHDLQLSSSVTFTGASAQVDAYFAKASVVVLPSIIEGLPAVILEAQYAGVPVVAYDVGGIAEIMENNKTGKLIPLHNEDAFAEAVVDILGNNTAANQWVQAARKQVESEFLLPILADKFVKIYKELLETSGLKRGL